MGEEEKGAQGSPRLGGTGRVLCNVLVRRKEVQDVPSYAWREMGRGKGGTGRALCYERGRWGNVTSQRQSDRRSLLAEGGGGVPYTLSAPLGAEYIGTYAPE